MSSTIYEKFLRMLDFEEEELARLLPHWINACRLLKLSEEDVRFATEDWIPQYWDMSMTGVRRCIGAYIRELIEMTRLAEYKKRGDKILYCNMPAHPASVFANKVSGGERLHVSHPDFLITSVLNAFFHRDSLMIGRESCMNSSCHHCGMNRLRADAQYEGIIVPPTTLWNWGLYCNEGPKTEELIQCMGQEDWNYVITTIPHDVSAGVSEADNEERVRYLARQLREGQRAVSEHTGIKVADEHIVEALEQFMQYSEKVGQLTELVASADPQPACGNDLTIFGAPLFMAFDTGFKYLEEAVDIMIEEVKMRIARQEGPLPADSPKLACHFVPFCVPWVSKAFLDNGVNLSISLFSAPAYLLRKYFNKDDVYKTVAQQWFCNPSAVHMENEAAIVSDMLVRYPLDGVLYGFFAFDRWIGSLQKTMIRIVEDRTGLPHFYLEGDFWNDSRYNLSDRISRIQNIASHVRISHEINGWTNVEKKSSL